ncbi:DMT family transporter [Oceanispirochaeta sp.]|uniref:DMT family transporter n=1 Tax=Oceanispirochaeta sp. TaxID=2035350 RepID=UPI0026264A47|nr:DMT family transporter [Oceanispirochaeta sp.]MDA3957511.1 DMT family transporter [Oceanispirochaeta sp.]
MYPLLSIGLGALIALMITLNSQLASLMGIIPASLVLHLVGLGTITAVIALRDQVGSGKRVPLFLRLGGLVGVGLTLFNIICFQAIGASLTIALGILGQTLAGQIVDITGFLGMEKHPFHKGKLAGWILILLGVQLMAGGSSGQGLYVLLAFMAGTMVMLSSVLNAQLAQKIGIFRATRNNFIMGLAGLIVLLFFFWTGPEPFYLIPRIHPFILAGGGVFAVLVVSGMNLILPKIPTVYSTILIFSGQISTGLIVDYFLYGQFSVEKAVGALVILLGLAVKTLIDRHVAASLMEASSLIKTTLVPDKKIDI